MSSGEGYPPGGEPYAWPPHRRPSGGAPTRTPVVVPVALLVLLVAGLFALGVYWWRTRGPANEDAALYGNPRPVDASNGLYLDEKHNIELYNRAKHSVVHITTVGYRRDMNLDIQKVPEGTGSGFVWDEGGHIVTNFHVIKDVRENLRRGVPSAQVALSDNKVYNAVWVGDYPDKDMAVLKIDAPKSKLKPIPVGKSEDLQVGQYAYAIGNPFGLDFTFTTGVVSAVGREIESVTHRPIRNVIQTDAAINPGNSGGPLLDSSGRLIGMNTAIYSPSGSSAGIGFAIPVDEINRVVPQLIRSGKVTRPGLGVQVFSDQQVSQLGLQGALIKYVLPDSPAARAQPPLRGTHKSADGQIEVGDLIVAVGDKPVKKNNDLYSALEDYKTGDKVKISVVRDDQEQHVEITLGSVE